MKFQFVGAIIAEYSCMHSGVGTHEGFSGFVNHRYCPDQNVASRFNRELGSGNGSSDKISISIFDNFYGFQDSEFKEEDLFEGGRVSNSIGA